MGATMGCFEGDASAVVDLIVLYMFLFVFP